MSATQPDPRKPREPSPERLAIIRTQVLQFLNKLSTPDLLMLANMFVQIDQKRRLNRASERALALRSQAVMLLDDEQLGLDDQSRQIAHHALAKAARRN